MDIQLKYGRRGLSVSFPQSATPTIIRKPVMPLVEDTAETIRNALFNPIGGKPLLEIGRGVQSVAIAVCDITRPVPNGLFLRPLIECLIQAGIKRSHIKILIATGLHRPNEGAELAELVLGGREGCRDQVWLGAPEPVEGYLELPEGATEKLSSRSSRRSGRS